MKIIVKKDDSILNTLINELNISKNKAKSYLRNGCVYINKNIIYKNNFLVYTNDNIIVNNKKELNFDVLFEDDNIVVINKPSGLLTISDGKTDNTLYHILREHYKRINKNNKIFIVHRLDKDTSGIVIFAKNEKIKNILQNNWNDYVKLREYTAVVYGKLNKKEDKLINYLKINKQNIVYVSNNGKKAITNYKVIKESKNYSYLSINIETGRTNQIRAVFNNMKNPILGDKKYGIKDNFNRLYLHANKLKIYYPILKKDILFETKVPLEFKKIINDDNK